ncbi:MAG: hypothetical protein V3R41_07760, partial [Gammaproteobacteria bacterium]
YTISDSATINDSITVGLKLGDSATVDDSISMRVFIRLTDGARGDSATLSDLLSAKSSIKTMSDSATIDDSISKKFPKDVQDSANVDDSISIKVFIRLTDGVRGDSSTVTDFVSLKAKNKSQMDSATVDDAIEKLLKKDVNDDSATISDSITYNTSPPSTPTNIECNGDNNCNIVVDNTVDVEGTGSTDPDGNPITYSIEASLEGVTTVQNTTDISKVAGDGATFNWIDPVEVTPSIASSWENVTVSDNVPGGATGVILHVVNTCVGGSECDLTIGLRFPNSNDDRTNIMYPEMHFWAMIGIDENQIFQANVQNTTLQDIFLVGYTQSGVTFFDDAKDKSLATTGQWTAIDISGDTGTDTAIAAIIEIDGQFSQQSGLRNANSTDNRLRDARHSWAIVGVNSTEEFEGHITDTNIDFFLVGYVTKGATFFVNATDKSLSSLNSWLDIDISGDTVSETANGAFIEVIGPATGDRHFGLRKADTSENILEGVVFHPWGFVETNRTEVLEGQINNANVDFFLNGYSHADNGTQYNDLIGDIDLVTELSVTVEVDSYDASGSHNQSNSKPDLVLEIYNGAQFIELGNFSLPASYTGDGLNTTDANFTITTTDSEILIAWETLANQDLRIKGAYMDFGNSTAIDEINYTNIFVNATGKIWTFIGDHNEGTPLTWDTSSVPNQKDVNLRTRAIDLTGSNTYSDYFVKNSLLRIFHGSILNVTDSTLIDDSITLKILYGRSVSDSALVDDVITAVINRNRSTDDPDSMVIDDSISTKVFIRLTDGARAESIATADKIFKKTFLETEDSASIDDSITTRIIYGMFDSATVDDTISKRVFIRL